MKIGYISNVGLSEGWAHSSQVMDMCSAFSSLGHNVTLIVPKRNNLSTEEIFNYYNISKTFEIKKIPCIDLEKGNPSSFLYWIRFISFYTLARFYVWFNNFDFLYSRDFYSPVFFPGIILEQHHFHKSKNFVTKIILSSVKRFIVLTSFIKKLYIENRIKEENILVSPDAVDVENFVSSGDDGVFSKNQEDFIFGYVGTLKTMGHEKGVGIAIESLKYLPEDFKFVVVGGENEDIEFYKQYAKNIDVEGRVIFIGKVLRKYIPDYLSKFDCAVAPFPENEHYSFYMSPLKIFEYMASRKPIITTDLPSIREVLTDGLNAILIKPGDPKALTESIIRLKKNPELGKQLADRAYQDVISKYTWQIRARNIISFIEKK